MGTGFRSQNWDRESSFLVGGSNLGTVIQSQNRDRLHEQKVCHQNDWPTSEAWHRWKLSSPQGSTRALPTKECHYRERPHRWRAASLTFTAVVQCDAINLDRPALTFGNLGQTPRLQARKRVCLQPDEGSRHRCVHGNCGGRFLRHTRTHARTEATHATIWPGNATVSVGDPRWPQPRFGGEKEGKPLEQPLL